jgi:hypothetical protein
LSHTAVNFIFLPEASVPFTVMVRLMPSAEMTIRPVSALGVGTIHGDLHAIARGNVADHVIFRALGGNLDFASLSFQTPILGLANS